MGTVTAPANMGEALEMLESAIGFIADADVAQMPAEAVANLLPRRAGQPVKALVHISFADLLEMDAGSALQDKWIEEYRARWAAQRAAVSVSPGDGGGRDLR
jgi:hypothetical protein